jgi:hypothetical protein
MLVMKKIVLISCVSKKLPHEARAEDLYISPLFKFNLRYAKQLNPDEIYILSAKHGVLELDVKIEPYDTTLNKMGVAERRVWSDKVLEQLATRADLQRDHFVFLAGQNYRKYVVTRLASFEAPMEGLRIGMQLQKLKEMTS